MISLDFTEHLVRDERRGPECALAGVPRDDTDVGLTGVERKRRLGDTLLYIRHDVRRIVEEWTSEKDTARVQQMDHIQCGDPDIFTGPFVQLSDVLIRAYRVTEIVERQVMRELAGLIQDGALACDRL